MAQECTTNHILHDFSVEKQALIPIRVILMLT